jgi:UDP-N-acetyl-D-glucosamine dehydrogenase
MLEDHLARIEASDWNAGVVGLGYVGLPLLVTMAQAGIEVTGFDVDRATVYSLAAGRSHVDDVADEDLAGTAAKTRFTDDVSALRDRDVIFICVPTPLAVGKQPDLSYIESAGHALATVLKPGHVVILESTTYPGTTEETLLPILQTSGLALDRDFFLAYAPERVNPGDPDFHTSNIPRIVGGASEASTKAAELIYKRFINHVHVVSSARAAEFAKLLENTFRWVNIALVNELATLARAIDINIWEVIDAAATKPFGYMPFYPGPGVGGHCIPLDPFYLAWTARRSGDSTRFIELAETINARMPHVAVARIQEALNAAGKPLQGSRVLALGVAFKPNVRDYRESPALEVIRILRRWGAEVSYSDPLVETVEDRELSMRSLPLSKETVAAADCVVLLCDHDAVDYETTVRHAPLIVDTRNALARRGLQGKNVHLL